MRCCERGRDKCLLVSLWGRGKAGNKQQGKGDRSRETHKCASEKCVAHSRWRMASEVDLPRRYWIHLDVQSVNRRSDFGRETCRANLRQVAYTTTENSPCPRYMRELSVVAFSRYLAGIPIIRG